MMQGKMEGYLDIDSYLQSQPMYPFYPAVMMYRRFQAENSIARARLYITAHGVYEFYINAEAYAALHKKITELFEEEYITRTGRMVSETQTGCVLALHFGLAQEKYRGRIAKSLETNIANHKNHLSTGFVGTPYLCHVLSENGMHDLAGTIFLKEDYPSWLYAVKKGATTIWERWNSIMPDGSFDESGMNSLNHYAYGSIGDWMYEKLAGISPLQPGYKEIRIKPQFIKGITGVDASFDSVYGVIRSAWSCKDGKIVVDVSIPANTAAQVYLPEKEEVLRLGSGSWHYESYRNDGKYVAGYYNSRVNESVRLVTGHWLCFCPGCSPAGVDVQLRYV